jgi:Chitin synthase export chaperone
MFFILAILSLTIFSNPLCILVKHYLDGLFLSSIFNLLSVMMVFKYWDGITKEDLEFAVGIKKCDWEIVDPLLSDSAMARMSNGGGL